ncbi:hypothetical protein G7070_16195 [Propioniciclava coleopterorum]|uniref:DUF2262 domain-containing protein n=1 Tax=Propioniciclava coleopterorum TaxID=2714937 RepID=A0A6G7Y9M7_9ACTN|nr:hypothetical protein [Propioniciclava coleopterorum]QIK73522.1 hypothetical protein G7070_16195 [Propioniciclava coleopterorum]
MSTPAETVDTPYGRFARATSGLFVAGGDPELAVSTQSAGRVPELAARLAAFARAPRAWTRRATDAVVRAFSEGEPSASDLDEAAADLRLETVEVRDDGAVVLHLEDGCGEHFMQGYWPAVRFDDDGDVVEVTVEA